MLIVHMYIRAKSLAMRMFVVLLLAVSERASAAVDEPLLERFRSEAPVGWRESREFLFGLEGSCVVEVVPIAGYSGCLSSRSRAGIQRGW